MIFYYYYYLWVEFFLFNFEYFIFVFLVMLRDGFGENLWFGCLIVEEFQFFRENYFLLKRRVIGYVIFYQLYFIWKGRLLYIEDVYVELVLRGVQFIKIEVLYYRVFIGKLFFFYIVVLSIFIFLYLKKDVCLLLGIQRSENRCKDFMIMDVSFLKGY